MTSDLANVKALVFDVFGTTVDWHSSLVQELSALGKKHQFEGDWSGFAEAWRAGYAQHIQMVGTGGSGAHNIDQVHREILDKILATAEWKEFGTRLDNEERHNLNNVWHRLHGWPDATEGLYALKKQKIIVALSNGNVRLLANMAKFADLPWDVVFSAELFGSLKPNVQVYEGAVKHLSLEPHECAMVAAHAWDLRSAAKIGMKTIFVKRYAHEPKHWEEEVKVKSQGGEVDLVVDSFTELAVLLGQLVF
ncbi:haloacid dehalogenase [Roridomyces roridus]|uniref:Haloacid dehalogenase n=1 Tax=Roridomyces roridus TaxID=1738132 RepID=A0AAD7F788_9AGAR|nr:haloacid dehalogenase [Roridomyces roridus]